MSERPTLSVAVPCPTCGGTGIDNNERNRMIANNIAGMLPPCMNCDGDGTIRQAVSCQSCRFYKPSAAGREVGTCLYEENNGIRVHPDWGCLSWEAKA